MKGVDIYDLTEINNTSVLRFLFWALEIRRAIRSKKPDILHAHQIQAAGWLGYLSGYHPFVVTAWGSDILVAPERSYLLRILTGRVLSHCDILTVPSKLMYEKALSLGFPEDRLKLIPWGIESHILQSQFNNRDEIRKCFGIESEAKVLLCPRGINRIYNIDVAIKAFNEVVKEEQLSRLAIVLKSIDEDYHLELLDLVNELDLNEFVYWIPQQNSLEDMARLYQMSDILISIPSSEGYGFTVFEALSSGCPTLITDLPVFENILIDGVHTLKISVRDVDETSQALIRLLSNNELQERLQDNGLKFGLSETVNQRIEQTISLYESLV
jgi:glycosyltransferase involved in cell wall biosynthesis